MGNTGNYVLSAYKVVFKDLTEVFQCAVVGPTAFGGLSSRPVIPDHTLLFITFDEEDEAFYYAGLLNSLPARAALYSASVGVQTQRYFPTDVSRVVLPDFNSKEKDHREVVRISKECHKKAVHGAGSFTPSEAELELSAAVSTMWNISRDELKHVADYYAEIQTLRSRVRAQAEDESGSDL
ncbi:MAG: hypothetical protein ACRD2O_03455 [Terriglobia bacterium]